MISLKKGTKSKSAPKQDPAKIDREMPYFIALVTLMAASGISPFSSLKKIAHLDLLPSLRQEARSMTRQVEILGMDPLTVMSKRAEETKSKLYQDFLAGYVSTVQTGGSIVHFLKSKMQSIFDLHGALAKHLVTKLSGLVDAYMIIQVVILTMYIMFVAVTSTPTLTNTMSLPGGASSPKMFYIFLVIPPLISAILMVVSHMMTTSTYMNTQGILKKTLLLTVMAVLPAVIIPSVMPLELGFFGLPYLVGLALISATIIPFLAYQKMEKMNTSAERATPSVLRDIAEARKTGLPPERCIEHAFRRKGYDVFAGVLDRAVSQLKWGVPLRNITSHIRKEVSSWFVLINFQTLIEVIDSGGGYPEALNTLAEYSDKMYNVEKEKKEMLKPYVMIAFMITGITAFTTLVVIDSFGGMADDLVLGAGAKAGGDAQKDNMRDMFGASIVFQAYLVGLFLGKITTGSFAGGLKSSILLTITVLVVIIIIEVAPMELDILFAKPT